jgi:hypothetical protein
MLDIETENTATPTTVPPPKTAKAGGGKKATVKKAAKKDGAKPAKKAKGSPQAQSGDAIELPIAEMNKDELKLVKHMYSKSGERKPYSIKDLKAVVGGKTTLRVRNALRRPVRGGWLEKVDRGQYRLTEKGRKRGIGAQS